MALAFGITSVLLGSKLDVERACMKTSAMVKKKKRKTNESLTTKGIRAYKGDHNHEPLERSVSRTPTQEERDAIDEVLRRLSPIQALAELKKKAVGDGEANFVPSLQYLKSRRKIVQGQELSDLQQLALCDSVYDFFLRRAGVPGIQVVILRKEAVRTICSNNPNSAILFCVGTYRIFK